MKRFLFNNVERYAILIEQDHSKSEDYYNCICYHLNDLNGTQIYTPDIIRETTAQHIINVYDHNLHGLRAEYITYCIDRFNMEPPEVIVHLTEPGFWGGIDTGRFISDAFNITLHHFAEPCLHPTSNQSAADLTGTLPLPYNHSLHAPFAVNEFTSTLYLYCDRNYYSVILFNPTSCTSKGVQYIRFVLFIFLKTEGTSMDSTPLFPFFSPS